MRQGCIALASLLAPPTQVNGTNALPPLPAPSSKEELTTFEDEGVTLEDDMKKKISALAAERDLQHGKNTPKADWKDLYDRARQLFCDAALPRNVSRLLTCVFLVSKIFGANCETVLAKVLAKA